MALAEILALSVAVVVIFLYVQRKFSYWKTMEVPYKTPTFPFGNVDNPLLRKCSLHVTLDNCYRDFKLQNVQHFGFYLMIKPIYVPIDPDIIKGVLMKDFDHFVDRGFYYNEEHDPLSAHVFTLGGQKWRELRTKLTSTFTSGKMKTMFGTLIECSKGMDDFIRDAYARGDAIDIKNVLQRFTIDVIGSCAFGIECNSFQSESDFQKYGTDVMTPTTLRGLKNFFTSSNPDISRKMRVGLIPKNASKFFFNIVEETVNYRRSNNVRRNDMLQLVMDLQSNDKTALTLKEIAAQAFVFFLAGFDTSSTTMTFCLYELAKNQDLQSRVRKEVKTVLEKHGNKITYDAIMEMKYMQQVIDETLRKYPPVTSISRECVKDYQVPNTSVLIKKGTLVFIPIYSLHRDPEYFEEPEKFDPERFSLENRSKITPFTYLPFGEGPRMCIGLRFGLMQTKVGLCSLLKEYNFTVNKTTKTRLQWQPFSFVLDTESPIWLNVEKIETK